MYPFFKTAETIVDKIFNCKKAAVEQRNQGRKEKIAEMERRAEERNKEYESMNTDTTKLKS